MTFAILIQAVFARITREQREELAEIEKARKARGDLLGEVAEQLGKSSELSSSAEETAAATVEIEQNVRSIKERISELGGRFNSSRAALARINESLDMDADRPRPRWPQKKLLELASKVRALLMVSRAS